MGELIFPIVGLVCFYGLCLYDIFFGKNKRIIKEGYKWLYLLGKYGLLFFPFLSLYFFLKLHFASDFTAQQGWGIIAVFYTIAYMPLLVIGSSILYLTTSKSSIKKF